MPVETTIVISINDLFISRYNGFHDFFQTGYCLKQEAIYIVTDINNKRKI